MKANIYYALVTTEEALDETPSIILFGSKAEYDAWEKSDLEENEIVLEDGYQEVELP